MEGATKKREKISRFRICFVFNLLNVTGSIKQMPETFKTANFDF